MRTATKRAGSRITPLDEKDSLKMVLEECRMVLPGIQALFGFQLVAVFNGAFWQLLWPPERLAHLAAISLMALAMCLVLAPAAFHRLVEPNGVSPDFLRFSTRMLTAAMGLLMGGSLIDVYVISRAVLQNVGGAAAVTGFLVMVFAAMWFAWPLWCRRRGE